MFTKAFWKSTSERAVHTAAQTLAATLGLKPSACGFVRFQQQRLSGVLAAGGG
ncbi:holin [Streptomyces sp. NPDC057539]|uniref:holin n=1 Tax=Streptomyces sp. NPDC057539 TaxID=3346159 RepID=UPI0036B0D977